MALNSQLLTVQILTNDVQVLILCLSYLIITVTDRFLTFSKNFLKMRSQTEVKEKKRKNVSRDNIVSKLKYDFTKNLAQLQRTLRLTLILMAKIRQKFVHSM